VQLELLLIDVLPQIATRQFLQPRLGRQNNSVSEFRQSRRSIFRVYVEKVLE
jgi:hypothetical protein